MEIRSRSQAAGRTSSESESSSTSTRARVAGVSPRRSSPPLSLCEVPQGNVGFGDHELVVNQRRDQPKRMQRQIVGRRLMQGNRSQLDSDAELGEKETHLQSVGRGWIVVEDHWSGGSL